MKDLNLRNNYEVKIDDESPLLNIASQKDNNFNEKGHKKTLTGNFLKKLFFYELFKFVAQAKFALINKMKPKLLNQKKITEFVDEFHKQLHAILVKNLNKITNIQLICIVLKVFKKDFFLCSFLYIIDNTAKVTYSLLVAALIDSISEQMKSPENFEIFIPIQYAVYILAIMLVHLFSGQHNWFLLCKASNHLKLTLLSIIYNKLYRLSYTSLHNANQGKLFNIISGDMNILENKVSYLLAVLMAPYAIFLSSILLYLRFGWISMIALICLMLVFLLQFLLAKFNLSIVRNKSLASDKRIHLTNELLEEIRPIKMYAWEPAFIKNITDSRNDELIWIKKMNLIISLNKIVAKITPFILSSAIFLIHYFVNQRKMVSTSSIFSTFQLFDFISIYTVLYFGLGALTVLEYKNIFERIAAILSLEEDSGYPISSLSQQFLPLNNHEKPMISIKNYTGFWSDNMNSSATLKEINLEIYKSQKVGVLGKIGSGKSSLLYSLLNEIPRYQGNITLSGSIAFIEHSPFIFSSTIKENILFGLIYSHEKYNEVITSCALNEDFQSFPDGDLTEIGEKGVTLSGGQKIRICLARALYANADIYLLDDPFSCVDSKVAKLVFEKIFKQGLLKEKTVVLVTHHLEFIHQMDRIVLMDEGKIQLNGSSEEIIPELKKLEIESFENTQEKDDSFECIQEKTSGDKRNFHIETKEFVLKRRNSMYVNEESEEIQVNVSAYKKYLGFSKGNRIWMSMAVFLFILAEIVRFSLMRIFGVSSLQPETVFFCFYSFLLVYLVISLIKYEVFNTPLLRSNTLLHNTIIECISRTSINFFDTNPVGRILNRFTNDLGIIDSLLLITMRDNLEFLISYCVLIFSVFYTCYYLMIPAVLLIWVYIILYNYFKLIITESKKLDLLSRGPIFSFFASTISGLLTIRVYDQVENFKEKYCKIVEENSNKNLQFWAITRVYSFVLEFFGIIFSFIGILALIQISPYMKDLGLISQSMISLIFMTEIIQYAFTLLINSELMMNSAVRLFNYSQIEDENKGFHSISQFSPPEKIGEILFKNTFLKYGENGNMILKNINFHIKPGEKIGCVGRTGSGKSSLIQALFGMVRCEKQSEIYVNGILIQDMGLKALRSGISIIPQNPFMFSGTIRQNMDPFDEYSMEQINNVLNDVNLYEYIQSLPKKLESFVSSNSSVFSMGQKQMICLARALLRNSPILVLDEATSSCDLKCDEFIQKKINEKFKKSTVFTIAHRLLTIAEYDKVMVVKRGEIVEFENPYKLLIASFNENERKNEFAEMVKQSGPETAQLIFTKAKTKYLQNNSEFLVNSIN